MLAFAGLIVSLLNTRGLPRELRLASGKRAMVVGSGPPVVFSSGIFNVVSTRFYSEFLRNVQSNVSTVLIQDFQPLECRDIDEVADAVGCETVGLIAHSSFDARILSAKRLECAVLCDPICLPNVNTNGFRSPSVNTGAPVLICRAQYLYESDITIPSYQTPSISGDAMRTVTFQSVGHADILDDFWAKAARYTNLWVAASNSRQSYNDWTGVSPFDLTKYRRDLANACVEFVLDPTHQ